MAEQILTPVGRIVQGTIFTPNTTNQMGQPLVDKQGNPRQEYYLNLALPKDSPETQQFLQQLGTIAASLFPQGECNRQDFNWKFFDGDLKADKVGMVGHYVFKFKTGFQVPVYKSNGSGFVQLTSPEQCKIGDYVRVAVTVNDNRSPIGLYLNHSMIEHVGYGEPILNTPDPGSVFTQPVTQLPPGASQTPTAGTTALMPPMGQPQQQQALMPPMGQPQQQQAPMPPMGQPQQQQAPAHYIGAQMIDPNNI